MLENNFLKIAVGKYLYEAINSGFWDFIKQNQPIKPKQDIKDKQSLALIKELDLKIVYTYSNGDSAWISMKDEKIYDYNHELETFNVLAPKKYQKNLQQPVHYKIWLNDVKSKKHKDAWKY